MHSLGRAIYTLATVLLTPLFLVALWLRKDYRKGWRQRLGWYTAGERGQLDGKAKSRCWIHAVSIGEMHVALHFIEAMKPSWPELDLVLTTATAEGRSLAERRRADGVKVLWAPCDLPSCLRRAFRWIQPDFIVLVELELWPNQLRTAATRQVPVVLINARMPPADARRYRLGRRFFRDLFSVPVLICAQGTEDAERFRRLGAPPDRLQVTGNLKFDLSLSNGNEMTAAPFTASRLLSQVGVAPAQPVMVAGSTHAGEENILFAALADLRKKGLNPFLILAPRNTRRAFRIAVLGQRKGLHTLLRSETGPGRSPPECPIDCLVLDSMGELPEFYRTATVIFVGGSLVGHGGHNIMEAAASGQPVVFGPHMENFQVAARQFLAEGGAVQVQNAGELRSVVERLLRAADERERIAAAARRVLDANAGATERTLELLMKSLRGETDRPSRLEITRAEISAPNHPETDR